MDDLIARVKSLKEIYVKNYVQIEKQKEVRVYEYKLTDSPSWLIYFAPGVELIEAERSLKDRYRERLINVREKK